MGGRCDAVADRLLSPFVGQQGERLASGSLLQRVDTLAMRACKNEERAKSASDLIKLDDKRQRGPWTTLLGSGLLPAEQADVLKESW